MFVLVIFSWAIVNMAVGISEFPSQRLRSATPRTNGPGSPGRSLRRRKSQTLVDANPRTPEPQRPERGHVRTRTARGRRAVRISREEERVRSKGQFSAGRSAAA